MNTEKVAQRIQFFMEKKGLTFSELAERTGIEPGFLESIQTKNVYPSLGPLLKIARALGVRLGTFLDDQVSQDPLIVRKSDRKEDIGMVRSRERSVSMTFHSLGRGKSDRHMEPFFIEMLPEPGSESHLSSHEGEEFIVVTSGQVEVIYGQDRYVLNEGDSIYYNSIVPHDVSCRGDQKASIYAVLYIPE
jgi:transcriptional regulator with XRE-family HTH domain